MPRTLSRLALLAAAAFAVTAVGATAQAGELKWITSKTQNAGDAQQLSMSWLQEQFKIRTGGKEEIKIFWGGSVAKDKEIPDFISGGAADMGDIITPYFPDKFPLNNAVGYFIPQPHSTIEIAELMEYWHRVYPQFDQELAKYNLKVIGFRPLENYGMICTKPIKSIEDFKGKRIRTYGFAYPRSRTAGSMTKSPSTSSTFRSAPRSAT
jgi:TRAP-type C4-dicarboxylate transport system substrate-binding protein